MTPPAVVTTRTSPICHKCGTIGKSGKMSCCGRGGSWFRNCGGIGNTQLHHTWYEGIQACRRWMRSKTSVVQRLNDGEKFKDFLNGAGMANSTVVTAPERSITESTNTFAHTATSTSMSLIPPAYNISTGIIFYTILLVIMTVH